MSNRNNQVLDESTQRTKGIDALNSNIEAAKAVASIVKTTLGPMGMDKMLIDSFGDSVITNDGVKILKEMEIDHPGAKMLVEVAKTQDTEVGDGTTTAVIFSGELLSVAQKLLSQKIHPTTIIRWYKLASKKALEILSKISVNIDVKNEGALRKVCETAVMGKVADQNKEELSKLLFDAVLMVKDENGVSKKNIKIQKIAGGDISESFVVKGIVLDKEPANKNVSEKRSNAKILLVDFPLEVRELDNDANLQINTPQDYENFLNQEEEFLKNLAYTIKDINADVVICQKGIDDKVSYFLAQNDILSIRRTRKSDMEKLSKALGVKVVTSIDGVSKENLGLAGSVEIKDIGNESFIFIEKINNPKAITLFLKSSTRHVLDELERACEDAIGDLNSVLKSKKIVAGGGAVEVELYKQLIEFAKSLDGKEQLIVKEFAKSFLVVPKTLCENCGFDELDTISKLISNHEKGLSKCGLNGFKGVVNDTIKEGIIEPINVKVQVIKSATEISSMILRIDDIIAAKKLRESKVSDEL